MMLLLALCLLSFTSCKGEVECGPGNFIYQPGWICKPCPLNTYSKESNTFSCNPCPSNRITQNPGATSEFHCVCKAGYGADMPFSSCWMCPTGTYNDGKGNGTEKDTLMCKPCPRGYTTMGPGTTDVSKCTVCQPGYLENSTVTPVRCDPCPKGTYSNNPTDTSCTSCPEGHTSREGSSQPWACHTGCEPGQWFEWDSCRSCFPNSYAPTGQEDQCIPCPEGYAAPHEGATSEEECTECAYGYYKDGDVCEPCPVGTYFSSGECVSCPIGKTTHQAGSGGLHDCVCAAGYVEKGWRGDWNSECAACAAGTYNDVIGATSCKQCPRWKTTKLTAQTSASACACEAGTYMHPDEQVCVRCGKGTYSEAGASGCTKCPPGFTTMSSESPSVKACVCQAGFFVNPDTETCQMCPPGSFSETTDETICTVCPEGQTVTSHQTGCE